jgi:dimethylargininase
VTERLSHSGVFSGFRQIIVPEGEEAAANALRVNDRVLVAQGHPRTLRLLGQAGYRVVALPAADIGKLDGGLSCLSLRWHG